MATKVLLAGLFLATLAIILGSGPDRYDPDKPRATTTTTTTPVLAALAVPIPIQPGALRLEGQAIDPKNQPVAGATITLAGARTVVTEQDGSFAFDGVAEGTYSLVAERDGMYGEAADEPLHDSSDPVMITMRRGPTLVVHVVAKDGTPIRDAKVRESSRERVTGADGTATFRALELGSALVEIHASGFAPQELRFDLGEVAGETIVKTVRLESAVVLEGIVVDDRDQRVAGARVRIEAAGDVWSESVDADDAGHFRFEAIGPGRHALVASGDRHLETPALVVVLDGRPRNDIVIRVQLGAEVEGIVVDARGKPIKGARVSVASGSAESDETGAFLVQGVDAGTHDISATSDLESSAVATITLARGARAKTRLVMVTSSIAGTIRDGHGNALEEIFVFAKEKTTGQRYIAHSDEAGHFDLRGLPLGVYALTAERRDESSTRDAVVLATVRSPSRNVALVLPEAVQIVGRVILDGVPVTHYGVSVTDDPDIFGTPKVIDAADGRFERAEVSPGKWSVLIAGPNFAKKIVEVVVGDSAIDLGDIVVDRGRIVAGRVVDDRGLPLAGATVGVSHDGNTGDSSLSAVMDGGRIVKTDADGRYRIVGLARDDRLRIAAAHSRGLSRQLPLPVDATTLDLVIEGSGSIRGRIDRMTTRPYMACAESKTDDKEDYWVSIDATGSFTFDRLPTGDYEISVPGDHGLMPQRVMVHAETSTEVVFEMPEHPITVRVHSPGCEIVYRQAIDETSLGLEVCTDDIATFKAVAPGTYRFCLQPQCITADIAESPDTVDVTLPP